MLARAPFGIVHYRHTHSEPLRQSQVTLHVLSRRSFVRQALAGAVAWPFSDRFPKTGENAPETLYNGIVLPSPWPPRFRFASSDPLLPPYIAEPPEIIPI